MNAYVNFIDNAMAYINVDPAEAATAAILACLVCFAGTLWELVKKAVLTKRTIRNIRSILTREETLRALTISLLRKYMYDHTTSRIMVFKYHNGDVDSPHFGSFSRQSVTHEVTAPGFEQLKPLYQNIPLSAYALCTEKMFGPGVFYVTDISKYKDVDKSTYEAAIKNKARCFCFRALRNEEDQVCGCVVIEYNRPVVFTVAVKQDILWLAEQLQSLITFTKR